MAMYRCGSNSGGGVTPTPITPSDSTPAALTANTPVNPTANGYAIVSQPQSVTPSTSGAAFNSGIVNMSSGGYAYSQKPKVEDYELTYDETSTTKTSHTVSNMNGKTVFVLLFSWYTSNSYAANRFDGATATGGTIEKICNLLSVTARTQGTFYKLNVTSDTCVISIANAAYIKVFEATGMA